ncbi:MAG: translocation/assembly module TamB domain-containing protein, partial [Muribaculaceae bacterium]|nr:translocation/assembly module TamB domain-containing protein [Muribaculaceae bacterium]
AFVEPSMGLKIPPMTLGGKASMRGGNMTADLRATTLGGKIALDARYNSNTEGYALDLDTHDFPVNAFMPDLGVGKATLTLSAKGKSFDMLARNAAMDARAHITSIDYSGYAYKDVTLDASLLNGQANVNASVDAPEVQMSLTAKGNLDGNTYNWTAAIDGTHIDMMALKLSETPMEMSVTMDADASYTPRTNEIDANVRIPDFYYKGDQNMEFTLEGITTHFFTNDSTTNLTLNNRDLVATASSSSGLNDIMARVDTLMTVLDHQMAMKQINVDSIQKALPEFVLNVVAGDDNMINDILRPDKMSIKHLTVEARNDSSLTMVSEINSLFTGSMRLDTVRVDARQVDRKLHMLATLDNKKGNLDEFAHVRLDGMLNLNNVSMRITQQNVSGETGYDFGAIAMMADSTVTGRFFPLNPVIGYKKWTINMDNFVKYDLADKHIDANLKMKGDDSSLQLYTDHRHTGDAHEHNDSINDLTLKISDIHLADWISFNPFAPPIAGDLSANLNLLWDGGNNINGKGDVALDNFMYDHKKVASMRLDLDVATNISGAVKAKADLMVDGERTMTLAGTLNDSESDSPFKLDFSVIHFPLSTVNPFLPESMAQLTGTLNGQMLVSGNTERPILNGEIDFSNAAVKVAMTNTSYAFSDVKIPVVDNIVTLSDFNITGANSNSLSINGKVDISSMADPKYDLTMKARDMMVVNSEKATRDAVLFGKGYIDLDVAAKGNLNFMQLDADLTILSGTNVTYVMLETPDELTASSTQDMVKFVNLSDSSAVAAADSLVNNEMLMAMDVKLTIQN